VSFAVSLCFIITMLVLIIWDSGASFLNKTIKVYACKFSVHQIGW